MSAGSVAMNSPTSTRRPPMLALGLGLGLGSLMTAAGLVAGVSLPVVVGVATFLGVAVASDVHSRRVPNLLTLPALLVALLASPWLASTSGLLEASIGAALGFLILIGPYALGGMGAGDVKALMALGAWTGPSVILGAACWALIAAGVLGVVLLAMRGELLEFARRWQRILLAAWMLRKVAYEPPPAESGAAGGIPFAVALAAGLVVQWLGGSPW